MRNGAEFLPRLVDSILAQDLVEPFELVIADNQSDDETPDLCQDYARRDSRVRFHRNSENIGQVQNFNRVLELARGEFFRWVGFDDWLEPDYARRCVAALQGDPEAILVTTFQDHIEDDGTRHYREYHGPRLTSRDPAARFRQMMWFLTADYGFMDPIYSMIRREPLLSTRRLQMVPRMDQVLASELALLGPFEHVPRCLSHRRRETGLQDSVRLRRFHPREHQRLQDSVVGYTRPFLEVLREAPLSAAEKIRCRGAVMRYAALWGYRGNIGRVRRLGRPLKQLWKTVSRSTSAV